MHSCHSCHWHHWIFISSDGTAASSVGTAAVGCSGRILGVHRKPTSAPVVCDALLNDAVLLMLC
eukprot:SAG31_NODE_1775_length_7303_cov_2.409356_9_plen_64_part_00